MTLEAYDGRKLKGFVYVSKSEVTGEKDPSSRYLGVLIKGNFRNLSIFGSSDLKIIQKLWISDAIRKPTEKVIENWRKVRILDSIQDPVYFIKVILDQWSKTKNRNYVFELMLNTERCKVSFFC